MKNISNRMASIRSLVLEEKGELSRRALYTKLTYKLLKKNRLMSPFLKNSEDHVVWSWLDDDDHFSIDRSFNWSQTREGHSFWSHQHNLLSSEYVKTCRDLSAMGYKLSESF